MSLSKGFLRRPMVFDHELRIRLVLLSIIWVSFSFILYTFSIVLREMLRLSLSTSNEPLLLTTSEGFFFNYFFAFLAFSISLGFVFRYFWFNPLLRARRVRYNKFAIATEMGSINIIVLFLMMKLAILYISMLVFGPVFLYFSFSDYPVAMLMLPLVIFVYQWSSINRVFLKDGLKWMFYSLAATIVLSFLFARVPVLDHERLNKVIVSASPAGHFRWDLPPRFSEAIEEFSEYRELMEVKIVSGFPLNSMEKEPVVFWGSKPFDTLDHATFSFTIDTLKAQFLEFEKDRVSAQLLIDRNTPMKHVKDLKLLLFRNDVRTIFLALKNKAVIYGSDNRFYFRQRIHYCDTAYNLNADIQEDIDAPLLPPCFEKRITSPGGMLILLKRGKFYVDGLVQTPEEIRLKVAEFLSGDNGNAVIRFWSDDHSRYEDYLRMFNGILAGYRDVLDAYMMVNFATSYRDCLRNPFDSLCIEAERAAREKHPQFLFDLSDQEVQLLIRNMPNLSGLFDAK